MQIQGNPGGRILLVAISALLIYATARVLQPLLPILSAAAIIAIVANPLNARLLTRSRIHPNTASAVSTVAICLILLTPLTIGGWYLVHESANAYPVLLDQMRSLSGPDAPVPAWVPQGVRDYLQDLSLKNLLLENIQDVGTWAVQFARSAVKNAASTALNALVFILALFVFLRDGQEVTNRLLSRIPLEARLKTKIVRRTHDMVIATVQGVFAVAVLQGVLSIAGLALFGVRVPVLLGVLCMLFSPIPFVGPAIVWIPVVAHIALGGEFGRAALVAGWFLLIVGTSDNILRPLLVGARSHVPVAIVVVGVLGGIRAFGAMGIFLGPVVMAMGVAVIDTLFYATTNEIP